MKPLEQRYGRAWAPLAVILFSGFLAAASYAQDSSNDPSQILRRLQENEADKPSNVERDPTVPTVVPYQQDDADRFVLTGVTITGATAFSGEELAHLYQDYMATEVGRGDLMTIADAATAFYQGQGYTLSRAYVPPQSIMAGVIELRIVEGYVEEVLVSGETGGVDVAAYTQRILAEKPLTQSTFERNLLLIHDLAGLQVTDIALAEKNEGSGAYTLGLTITHDTWEGSLYSDNRGTRAVGPVQLGLSASANSLLGSGEALSAALYVAPQDPNELLFGQIRLQQPIGNDGFSVGVSGGYSRTNPGTSMGANGRRGLSVFGSLSAQYPLIRMRNESLWLRGSLDVRNAIDETKFGIIFDDRLRVGRIKIDYFKIDEWDGTNFVSIGVAQGFDILGASGAGHRWASRPDGEVQFTKLFGSVYRRQLLWSPEWAVAVRAGGQLSSAPLLSSEEFGLGGAMFGRAYEYGELTGDDGIAASAELQYSPEVDWSFLDALTLFGFYDIGAVWNRHAAPGFERLSLASAGGGVRVTVMENVSVSLELAKPLTRDTSRSDDRAPQVYFSLSNPL